MYKDSKKRESIQKSLPDANSEVYDLFAVVNHLGNGHAGKLTTILIDFSCVVQ